MEQHPHNSDNRDREVPEPEKLEPGEIDLTGAIRQEDALRDVIGDALTEAESSGGEIPDWGARAIARALANRLDDPSSALHHFAVTGRANQELLARELAEIYTNVPTEEEREWVNRLGTYVINLPSETDLTEQMDAGTQTQPVPTAEAQVQPDNPQIAEGLHQHGDAFRAYLQLPDIDPNRDDLLQTFHECYVGTFVSMDALLNELTEISDWERAIAEVSNHWGIDGLVSLDRAKVERVARATWDIVESAGRFHVFSK